MVEQDQLQLVIKGNNLNELKNGVTKLFGEFNPRAVVNFTGKPETAETRDLTHIGVEGHQALMNETGPVASSPAPQSAPTAGPAPVQFAQAFPMTATATVVETDITGAAWNAELHASTKTKNADGSWKKRKGAGKLEAVAAEVTAALPIHNPAIPFAPPPPPPTVAVAMPAFPTPAAPVAQPVPQQVAPPQAVNYENVTQPQEQKAAHTFESFRDNLYMVVSTLISQKKLTPEYVQQMNAHYKLGQIWEATANENICRAVFKTLCDGGFITELA